MKKTPQHSQEAIELLQEVLAEINSHKELFQQNQKELLELLDFTDEDIAKSLFSQIDFDSLKD